VRSYAITLPFRPIRRYGLPFNASSYLFQFVREFMRLGFELHPRGSNYVLLGVLEGRGYDDTSLAQIGIPQLFTHDGGVCNVDARDYDGVFRTPTMLAVYQRHRLGRGVLRVYRRDFGCKVYDEIRGVVLADVFRDSYGSLIVYRKGGEYYALLDSIFSTFQSRLSGRPRGVRYSAGVAIVDYDDYSSVLSPRGVTDVPFPLKGFESLGGDSGEGVVYLFKEDDRRVFILDKMGVLEPVMLCRRPASILSRNGQTSIVCFDTGESIGFNLTYNVVSALLSFRHLGRRYFILLPYLIWVEDGNINVILVGDDESVEGYTVFVRLEYDDTLMSVSLYSSKAPRDVVRDRVWQLLNSVEGVGGSMLRAVGGLGFLVDGEVLERVIRINVRTCLPLSSSKLELCREGSCVKPISLYRCGDCCYVAYYAVDGDKLRVGDSIIDVRGLDVREVNVKVNIERLKLASYNVVMYEGFVKGLTCNIYGVDVASPNCRLLTVDRSGDGVSFRLYCDLEPGVLSGFLVVKCYGVDFPLVFPLARLLRVEEELGEITGVNLTSTKLFDLLSVEADGRIAFEVGGLAETVEGRVTVRMPYGLNELLVVDRLGVRRVSFLSPPPPSVRVKLRDNGGITLSCSDGCNVVCGSEVFTCRRCILPLRRVLGGECVVQAFSRRGFEMYDAGKLIRQLVGEAARLSAGIAQLLKLA
jgi:hypothetical protein